MSIDQEGIQRKRATQKEIRPGTIPDEGAQELRPAEETSEAQLAVEQGVVPTRQRFGDDYELPIENVRDRDEGSRREDEAQQSSLGVSRGKGGPEDPARAGGQERRRATTEYGANAEPEETGGGYVEGADPPAEGRDAPQG